MNTDKLTNWLGLAQAIGVALVTAYSTASTDGLGWDSPMFYVGMAVAALVAVKAYYTNKPSTPST